MVKLGWKAYFENDPLGLLNLTLNADQAGFDFIDLCNPSLYGSNPLRAASNWSWLGAAAAKTQQTHLGTCIPASIFHYDPTVIAETLQTLAAISSDRVFLAVVLGEDETGMVEDWKDQNEQQDILSEGIELVRALWGCEPVHYNSHYYHVRKAEPRNRLVKPVPLYLAVNKPGQAYTAGYYGDGVVVAGGLRANVCHRILDEFNRGARAAGKDPEQMVRMVELAVNYTLIEEPELIPVENAWSVEWLDIETGEDIFIPVTSDGKFRKRTGVDQSDWHTSNDPDVHAAYAQSYIHQGFNALLFHAPGPDRSEFLQSYARDVLPRIRASNLSDGM